MSADELQGLTYALCFGHQIVCLPISLPVPVFMADEWAKRGKDVYAAYVSVFFPSYHTIIHGV